MSEIKYDIGVAASQLVASSQQSRGDIIETVAKYLNEATSNGHTVNDAIEQILATPNYETLGTKSMLQLYAQAIKQADNLGISMPLGYSATYTALSRMRRVSGYDVKATFAPIAKLGSPSAKIKSLLKLDSNSIVVKSNKPEKPEKPKQPTDPEKGSEPTLKNADTLTLASALLAALKRDQAKLTSKDIETLTTRLSEIEVITDTLV